jgi:hypothetical protein
VETGSREENPAKSKRAGNHRGKQTETALKSGRENTPNWVGVAGSPF